MIRQIFVLSAFIISISYLKLNSQIDSFKNGAYRNSAEFMKRKPSYECEFVFMKITTIKFPDLYKIKTNNPCVNKKTLNNEIWAVYENKNLFINAKRLRMDKGYIRIEKIGKYSYFQGTPILSLEQEARLNNSALIYGLSGLVVTAIVVGKENKNKRHYILNLESGMVNLLTKAYMLRILQPYGDLLYSFQQEDYYESVDTMLKYIDLLNEKYSAQNNE